MTRVGKKTVATGRVPVKLEDMSAERRALHEKLLAEPGMRMFSQLFKLKDNPRLLVLVAHGMLELMVNALIDAKLKNAKKVTSDTRGYPHSTRLLVLNEMGVLSDRMYKSLEWFRRLRNRAAHEPLFEVTAQDLQILREKYPNPDKLHKFMVDLMCGFWNQHTEIFLPVFMPTLAERAKRARGGAS